MSKVVELHVHGPERTPAMYCLTCFVRSFDLCIQTAEKGGVDCSFCGARSALESLNKLSLGRDHH